LLVARSRLHGGRSESKSESWPVPSANATPSSAQMDDRIVARIARPGTRRHIFLEFDACREPRIVGQQLMLRPAEMRALGLGTKDYGQTVLAVRVLAKAGRVSSYT